MNHVVTEKLTNGDGGAIGVDKSGEVAMYFNCAGMFRAGANSKGFHSVKIWE